MQLLHVILGAKSFFISTRLSIYEALLNPSSPVFQSDGLEPNQIKLNQIKSDCSRQWLAQDTKTICGLCMIDRISFQRLHASHNAKSQLPLSEPMAQICRRRRKEERKKEICICAAQNGIIISVMKPRTPIHTRSPTQVPINKYNMKRGGKMSLNRSRY